MLEVTQRDMDKFNVGDLVKYTIYSRKGTWMGTEYGSVIGKTERRIVIKTDVATRRVSPHNLSLKEGSSKMKPQMKPRFKTISEANDNGWITAQQARSYAKIIDISGPNEFGYEFKAVSHTDNSHVLAVSITMYFPEEQNKIRKMGATCPMFRVSDLK